MKTCPGLVPGCETVNSIEGDTLLVDNQSIPELVLLIKNLDEDDRVTC